MVEHELQDVCQVSENGCAGLRAEVLKGLLGLPFMQVILAEVNLVEIYEGVPLLANFVSWLSDRGWVAFDICGLIRRPLDRALWQADMIFVPEIAVSGKPELRVRILLTVDPEIPVPPKLWRH